MIIVICFFYKTVGSSEYFSSILTVDVVKSNTYNNPEYIYNALHDMFTH